MASRTTSTSPAFTAWPGLHSTLKMLYANVPATASNGVTSRPIQPFAASYQPGEGDIAQHVLVALGGAAQLLRGLITLGYEALAETPKVRADLGYPPLVTSGRS